jgi:hypothetical protein
VGSAEEVRLTAAVAELEELIAGARPVPLTDQVRVRAKSLREAVGRVDEAAQLAGLGMDAAEPLAELERIAAEARAIPLTRDVRFDRGRIEPLLGALRPDPEPRG